METIKQGLSDMTAIGGFSNVEFAVIIALSLLGGVGSYLQQCRAGELERTSFNMMTELTLALTGGLTIAYICHWQGFSPALTDAAVLLFANNGGETMHKLKQIALSAITNRVSAANNEKPK